MHTVHTHKYNYKHATRNCKSSAYTFHKFDWNCRIYKYFCDCYNVRKKWLWLEQGILGTTFHITTRNMKIPDDRSSNHNGVVSKSGNLYSSFCSINILPISSIWPHICNLYTKESPSPLGKEDKQLFTTQYTPCMHVFSLCTMVFQVAQVEVLLRISLFSHQYHPTNARY